jgi:hypothetical protein
VFSCGYSFDLNTKQANSLKVGENLNVLINSTAARNCRYQTRRGRHQQGTFHSHWERRRALGTFYTIASHFACLHQLASVEYSIEPEQVMMQPLRQLWLFLLQVEYSLRH